MYVCMYVCMYLCMYVRRYVCMYVCMYVCIYIYMRIPHTQLLHNMVSYGEHDICPLSTLQMEPGSPRCMMEHTLWLLSHIAMVFGYDSAS